MKNIDELMKELKLDPQLVEIRRYFHRHPELSEQEYGTMEKICKLLDQWDIEYTPKIAGTGIVAVIRGKKPGKTVGLRGDIDALPINEEDISRPYCSQNSGVMHACGHDNHITILLGAARIISAMKEELNGNVKFFFQPAEESIGGAKRMIEAGCLENPHVDYVLGLHVEPRYPVGQVGIRYGKMYAASDMIDIKIHGKSAHGAHPDEGVDAIVVAANILNTLQTVVSRNTCPTNSAVCSFGVMKAGNVRNQIPDYAELQGTFRTLDPATRLFTREQAKKITLSVADAMGAKAEFVITESYSPLINTDSVVDIVRAAAEERLGKENVIIEDTPDLSVEDFSFFAAARPSCYFHLGCRKPSQKEVIDLHNPGFDVDERCLSIGVALQVKNVLNLLAL